MAALTAVEFLLDDDNQNEGQHLEEGEGHHQAAGGDRQGLDAAALQPNRRAEQGEGEENHRHRHHHSGDELHRRERLVCDCNRSKTKELDT